MSVKIDVGIYYRQKQATLDWYYLQGKEDASYTIGTLACATMIPCIVIAVWIGEVRGFDEELTNKIKGLVKFYGYKEILSLPENFPLDLLKV